MLLYLIENDSEVTPVDFPCDQRIRLYLAYSDAVGLQATSTHGADHNHEGLAANWRIEEMRETFNNHVERHRCSRPIAKEA